MNTTQQTYAEEIGRDRRAARVERNDSLTEGIMAGVVVVLTILGLFNIRPELMLPVAAIAMGAAFLLEGESISMRVSRLLSRISKGGLQGEQPRVGVTAELVAGIAGIILGFLALLGLYPLVLVPSAVIVYGSAMMFGSGLTARLNDLDNENFGEPACYTRLVCDAVSTASGIEMFFGLAAGILGIIALTGMEAVRIGLAALLIVAISSLLSSAAIIARMAGTHSK